MNNDSDNKLVPSSSGYEDLVDESIDGLNAEGNFSGTSILKKEQPVKRKLFYRSKLFVLLCVAFVINIILFLGLKTSPSSLPDLKTANTSTERGFRQEGVPYNAVEELIVFSSSFSDPGSSSLEIALDSLKDEIGRMGGDTNPIPQSSEFRTLRNGIYWIKPFEESRQKDSK